MKRILSVICIMCFTCIFYIQIKLIGSYPENMESFAKKLEVLIESNRFENITVRSGEKVICIYEGEHSFDLPNYKFAIYKETVEKNILFENMLYVEKDSGNIYTWAGEEWENLVLIGQLNKAEIGLPDSSEASGYTDLLYENMEIDKLTSDVMEALRYKVHGDLKFIYDGMTEFADRKYYIISSFSDHEDHIIRMQSYYLDMENGNLYRVGENSIFLRNELYYENTVFEHSDVQSETEKNIENEGKITDGQFISHVASLYKISLEKIVEEPYLCNEKNTQYTCKQAEEGYEVTLYDKSNKEIYSEVYPKEPWIKEVTENILEIGISTGSPSRHVFYFNKETSKISDVYFNSILLDNKYVAYMENSEELIIMDIFNEGILCKKVTRDFSKTANSGSAIINIEIVDEEKILLEYLSGEDYMEVAEIIKLF